MNKHKNYRFFEHKACEYYPCHRLERINCLFCFCPLYPYADCGGHYTRTKPSAPYAPSGRLDIAQAMSTRHGTVGRTSGAPEGLKDCSDCTLPHGPGGYDAVIKRLSREGRADKPSSLPPEPMRGGSPMYNLLLGGAAGQGIETTAAILETFLKQAGYHVFTVRDFMSRVRGGHNFTLVRFGSEPVTGHTDRVDALLAFNRESYDLHRDELTPGGFALCDSKFAPEGDGVLALPMEQMAKDLGNARAAGVVAVGAALKLFGVAPADVDGVLGRFVKPAYLEVNRNALLAGHNAVEPRLTVAPGNAAGQMLVSGNRALALGALAAGLKFYAAYPMSPSTTILEYLAGVADKAGIVVEQAEDEIAAVNMAVGASYAGARAMTGTSGGGFALMVETLGLSGMAEIPAVIVDVQRPGPVTGLPTRTEQSDLKFVISASQGEFPRMVLALRHHADAFQQTARAFHLADKYQIPVIILSDQYLGDATATVPAFDPAEVAQYLPVADAAPDGEYRRYAVTDSGVSPRLIPGMTRHLVSADSDEHDEWGLITESAEVRVAQMDKRLRKLEGLKAELLEPEFFGDEDAETLLVGWGSTWGPLREAVAAANAAGQKVGALVFGDVWPLPTREFTARAARAKRVVNVEQNATGQLGELIRQETGIACHDSFLKYDGRQLSAGDILTFLGKEESK